MVKVFVNGGSCNRCKRPIVKVVVLAVVVMVMVVVVVVVVFFLLHSFTYLTCRVCTVTEEGSTIFERD